MRCESFCSQHTCTVLLLHNYTTWELWLNIEMQWCLLNTRKTAICVIAIVGVLRYCLIYEIHKNMRNSVIKCEIIFFFKFNQAMVIIWCISRVVGNLVQYFAFYEAILHDFALFCIILCISWISSTLCASITLFLIILIVNI